MIAGDHPCTVVANREVGDRLLIATLRSQELAEGIEPGQFVHLSIPTLQANILRRPFSILDADPEAGTIDILYQVKGAGTADMATWQPGYSTDALGPLGRSWTPPDGISHALLVGGGVGAAPLLMLAKQLAAGGCVVDAALGGATEGSLVCRERFEQASNGKVRCATDDGSFGHHGFCTDIAVELIEESDSQGRPYGYIAICGPEPMMVSAGNAVSDCDATIQVSLEKRMACGIGACLSCVVNTTSGIKRVCNDGPVFGFSEVIW